MAEQVQQAPVEDSVRRYDHDKDGRIVKLLIGQGIMEGTAVSNQDYLMQPATLAQIALLGSAVYYASLMAPQSMLPEGRLATLLTPVIAICLAGLPFVGYSEYVNKPLFTALLRRTIGAQDLVDTEEFYPKQGHGGIWVFEHGNEVVGVVAVDTASTAGKPLSSVLGDEAGQVNERPTAAAAEKPAAAAPASAPGAPIVGPIAHIRHLDVDNHMRRRKIGTELVAAALDAAFSVSPPHPSTPITQAIILSNPLAPGGDRILAKCGFKPIIPEQGWAKPTPLGYLRQIGRWYGVDREQWVTAREAIYAAKKQ